MKLLIIPFLVRLASFSAVFVAPSEEIYDKLRNRKRLLHTQTHAYEQLLPSMPKKEGKME